MQETGRTASARPLAAVPSDRVPGDVPAEPSDPEPVAPVFDRFYYRHDCGAYEYGSPEWYAMFELLADRIMEELAPTSVLDAGCAMGVLVETLRKRGVDAWGMDVSEYAIEQVQPGARPYCFVGSLTDDALPEGLPERFDLVTCIEVVEHIPGDGTRRAIERLSSISDRVLFSSEPHDYAEATHVNVQPEEDWSALFASFGMFRRLEPDAAFLTPWTVVYERQSGSVADVVRRYDRAYVRARTELRQLRETALRHQERLAELEAGDAGVLADKVRDAEARLEALESEVTEARQLLSTRSGRLLRAWHAARGTFRQSSAKQSPDNQSPGPH